MPESHVLLKRGCVLGRQLPRDIRFEAWSVWYRVPVMDNFLYPWAPEYVGSREECTDRIALATGVTDLLWAAVPPDSNPNT